MSPVAYNRHAAVRRVEPTITLVTRWPLPSWRECAGAALAGALLFLLAASFA